MSPETLIPTPGYLLHGDGPDFDSRALLLAEQLTELSQQVGKWSTANFGQGDGFNAYLGLIEEIGELSHCLLKLRQGIRGTEKQHLYAARDAIGDISIYLADYCYRVEIDLGKQFRGHDLFHFLWFAELEKATRFWVPRLHESSAKLGIRYSLFSSALLNKMAIGGMVWAMVRICEVYQLGFYGDVVQEIWAQVRKRDWKANPQTGQVAE